MFLQYYEFIVRTFYMMYFYIMYRQPNILELTKGTLAVPYSLPLYKFFL